MATITSIEERPDTENMNDDQQKNKDNEQHDSQKFDYTWDQNTSELLIKIPVDEDTRKDDISINCHERSISVYVRGNLVLEGDFLHLIKFENETLIFAIDDGTLEISLDKQDKKYWDSLFKESEKVDIEELAERKQMPFEDLDQEAQQMINKMMVEQNKPKSQQPFNMSDPRIAEALSKLKEQKQLNESPEKIQIQPEQVSKDDQSDEEEILE